MQLNQLSEFNEQKTRVVFQFYADSSKSDDSGDGKSWATAKKNLSTALQLFSGIDDSGSVTLNVKGTHTLTQDTYCDVVGGIGNYVIDGGDDIILVDPNTFTANSSSDITQLKIDSTFSANYRGYYVRIIGGTYDGHERLIYEMPDNQTLQFVTDFSTTPYPCTFQIFKPATTITSSTDLILTLACSGRSGLLMQRFSITGNVLLKVNGNINLSGIIFENINVSQNMALYSEFESRVPNQRILLYNGINSLDGLRTLSTSKVLGVSFPIKNVSRRIIFRNVKLMSIYGCFFLYNLSIRNSNLDQISFGTTMIRLDLFGVKGRWGSGIRELANSRPVRIIEGGAVGYGGIYMNSSTLLLWASNAGGVNVARAGDSYDYGVYMDTDCVLKVIGPVTGSGSVAGVYSRHKNVILMQNTG